MMDFYKAIQNVLGTTEHVDYYIQGGELFWTDEKFSRPTDEEINVEFLRLQLEEKNNEYKSLRSIEYPSIGDQLDALFKAGVFPEEMADQIQAVKDKYPKPE